MAILPDRPELVTPADGDLYVTTDVSDTTDAGTGTDKKITWANLKAGFKAYFDTLYAGVLGADDNYVTDAEKSALHTHSNKTVLDNTTASFVTAQETKLGHISVSQAVNLDTMESDIATNNAKVTNATHTGEVTGSGALTLDKTAITGKTVVTAVGTDYVLVSDTSDSGNLKKVLASDLIGAGGAVEGTAVLSTGEVGGVKYLREDGDGTCSWQVPAGSGNVSKVGTPVDNQIGVWTGDGTIEGDAGLTFDTATDTLTTVNVSATTFTGALTGTASGNLTPGGALGTPSSGTLTNCSGLPLSGVVGSTTGALGVGTIELGHATDTTISRTGAGAIAVEGVGVALNSISLPHTTQQLELGHASDTTLSRVSAGVVAVEGVTVPTISSTDTFTNKRVTKRVGSTTSSATPTINTDNVDIYKLTAQTVDITSFTTNLSGTPTDGQTLMIQITGTAARAITWGASFEASTVALPTTTVTTNRLDVGFIWNTATSKWRCIASA